MTACSTAITWPVASIFVTGIIAAAAFLIVLVVTPKGPKR